MMGVPVIPPVGGPEVFADMELWAEIRRRVLTREISKRAACRIYEIHWATLKKVLGHEEPPGYRRSQPRRRPTIEPVLPVISQILADGPLDLLELVHLDPLSAFCAANLVSEEGLEPRVSGRGQ